MMSFEEFTENVVKEIRAKVGNRMTASPASVRLHIHPVG